jgi:3-hydroxy-9,10-secoandrosta-1,3,5(10)-triene-9,17-dione monooxygenase
MSNTAERADKVASRGPASYEELVERANALVPVLAQRAERAEELRRLPPENEADLHASGLYRMLQPKRIGGSECDYKCLITIGSILARGCPSTAWNLTNLSSHHWMLAMFPEAAQDRLWGQNADVLIASSFVFPAGKVRSVPGGYVLSGRWPFSSGVDPSDWNMLAGIVREENAAPDHRIFLVHRSDYEIVDTWHTMALKGTGSKDVVLDNVFVPVEMSVSVSDLKGGPTPGAAANPSALYQLPVFALFPAILSGVSLGNAEAAYDDYVDRSAKRSSSYSGARLSEMQSTQIKIGTAGAKLAAARRIMIGICEEATENAHVGKYGSLSDKMSYRRDLAYATSLCTDAVDIVTGASGAAALYLSSPVQRRFRDAHGIAAHIAFSMDAAMSAFGRVALGIDADNPTV